MGTPRQTTYIHKYTTNFFHLQYVLYIFFKKFLKFFPTSSKGYYSFPRLLFYLPKFGIIREEYFKKGEFYGTFQGTDHDLPLDSLFGRFRTVISTDIRRKTGAFGSHSSILLILDSAPARRCSCACSAFPFRIGRHPALLRYIRSSPLGLPTAD